MSEYEGGSEPQACSEPERSRRPGRRVVIWSVVAALVAAVLGYAYVGTRPEPTKAGGFENGFFVLESDRSDLGARVAGYGLPSPIIRQARCDLFRCGRTTLDAEAAAGAVVASLQPYGFSSGGVSCEPDQGAIELNCRSELLLDGASAGSVTAVRYEKSFRPVGVQTEVALVVGDLRDDAADQSCGRSIGGCSTPMTRP